MAKAKIGAQLKLKPLTLVIDYVHTVDILVC